MSAIAYRACVGKPTLYLRWPNLSQVLRASLEATVVSDETRQRFDEAAAAIDALASEPEGRFLLEVLLVPGADLISNLGQPTGDVPSAALWCSPRRPSASASDGEVIDQAH